MARPIEYDIDTILDNAMELFWTKGYERVSMSQLVKHTGLNTRTMYNLFKDKEGLFKDALDNYYLKASKTFTILKNNPGKRGIELFLQSINSDTISKGCLFNNSMLDEEFMKPDTFNIPKEFFTKLELQIEKNLIEASQMGEFNADPKEMALTMITFIHGFKVYGKYNKQKENNNIVIKNILNMIR